MTPFSEDPENKTLISFLKQHRPLPPLVSPSLEERVLTQIHHESRCATHRSSLWWWGIPGVLVAGSVVLWGNSHNPQPTAYITRDSQEIEAFVWENWSVTTGRSDELSSASATPVATEWMTLTEPHTVFVGARR